MEQIFIGRMCWSFTYREDFTKSFGKMFNTEEKYSDKNGDNANR